MGFSTIVEDLFESFGFFGGGGGNRRQRAQRGDDLRYDLEISLEEAAEGIETKLQIPRHEACASCEGTGREPGTMPETCGSCRGQGQVRFSQGFLTVARPCPHVPRPGQDQPIPVQDVLGRRTSEQGAVAQGDDPRRRGRRQSARLSGEGGPAGSEALRATSTSSSTSAPTRSSRVKGRICSPSCRSPFRRPRSATPSRCRS